MYSKRSRVQSKYIYIYIFSCKIGKVFVEQRRRDAGDRMSTLCTAYKKSPKEISFIHWSDGLVGGQKVQREQREELGGEQVPA